MSRTASPRSTLRTTLMLALFLVACAPATPEPAGESLGPWTLARVAPDTSDGIRILVLHDMEGLSGQSDPSTFDFGTPTYPRGQEMLVADVNAVIEGLFAGGATVVEVVDGHGSGNPDPDIRADLLDRRATQVLRDSSFDTYFDLVTPGAYDAVAVVGMHAKTGSGGFASHTWTLGIGLAVDGQFITETELVGLSWGRVDVPVIFGSGDDRLAADLATMPWIEFVTVKTAVGADSAVTRPVAEARAELTSRAQAAVENLRAGRAMAMRPPAPLRVGVRAVPPANLAPLEGLPGLTFADSTATYPVDSIRPGYDLMNVLVRNATRGYASQLPRAIREQRNGEEILARYSKLVDQTWFDYESGRWERPAPSTPAAGATPAPARKYHGYR